MTKPATKDVTNLNFAVDLCVSRGLHHHPNEDTAQHHANDQESCMCVFSGNLCTDIWSSTHVGAIAGKTCSIPSHVTREFGVFLASIQKAIPPPAPLSKGETAESLPVKFGGSSKFLFHRVTRHRSLGRLWDEKCFRRAKSDDAFVVICVPTCFTGRISVLPTERSNVTHERKKGGNHKQCLLFMKK